jgi:hypothetical protein
VITLALALLRWQRARLENAPYTAARSRRLDAIIIAIEALTA